MLQLHKPARSPESSTASVEGPRDLAQSGVAGAAGGLPHAAQIQASFGSHDMSSVRAHLGGAASDATDALGAHAYAYGEDVAIGDGGGDLFTVAHEAAHVVQQRAGKGPSGDMGEAGDSWERHADAVAERVVRGESAADLLDGLGAVPGQVASPVAVQRKETGDDGVCSEEAAERDALIQEVRDAYPALGGVAERRDRVIGMASGPDNPFLVALDGRVDAAMAEFDQLVIELDGLDSAGIRAHLDALRTETTLIDREMASFNAYLEEQQALLVDSFSTIAAAVAPFDGQAHFGPWGDLLAAEQRVMGIRDKALNTENNRLLSTYGGLVATTVGYFLPIVGAGMSAGISVMTGDMSVVSALSLNDAVTTLMKTGKLAADTSARTVMVVGTLVSFVDVIHGELKAQIALENLKDDLARAEAQVREVGAVIKQIDAAREAAFAEAIAVVEASLASYNAYRGSF